jgi:hypothetical protein
MVGVVHNAEEMLDLRDAWGRSSSSRLTFGVRGCPDVQDESTDVRFEPRVERIGLLPQAIDIALVTPSVVRVPLTG